MTPHYLSKLNTRTFSVLSETLCCMNWTGQRVAVTSYSVRESLSTAQMRVCQVLQVFVCFFLSVTYRDRDMRYDSKSSHCFPPELFPPVCRSTRNFCVLYSLPRYKNCGRSVTIWLMDVTTFDTNSVVMITDKRVRAWLPLHVHTGSTWDDTLKLLFERDILRLTPVSKCFSIPKIDGVNAASVTHSI